MNDELFSTLLEEEKPALDQLIIVDHLKGGSGGVYVVEDQSHPGRKFTLKTSTSPTALKDEILADAIYIKLGYKAPSFSVYEMDYDSLPEAIKTQVKNPTDGQKILFRVSEFIESKSLSDEDHKNIVKDQLHHGFVTDCLLANTDVAGHWKNVLIDKDEQVWRIDNGSTLRFRARGCVKELRTVVSELDTMRTQEAMMREVFGHLTAKDIQEQADVLLAQRDKVLSLFLAMNEKIKFDQPEVLLKILVNRFQYLHEHVCSNLFERSPSLTESSVDYTGAGVFIYTEHENKKYVLLGKRRGHDWWGSFGGATDQEDLFLRDTAVRETNEELNPLYQFHPDEIENRPSHDLIRGNPSAINVPKFRMYFVEKPYRDLTEYNAQIKDKEGEEHTELAWVPIEALAELAKEKVSDVRYGESETLRTAAVESINQSLILHPPFADMLQQDAVLHTIKELAANHALKENIHTRSRVSTDYPHKSNGNPLNADEITPMAERQQLAQVIVNRQRLHRELVAGFSKEQAGDELLPIPEPPAQTQADIHFQALMQGNHNASQNSLDKVKTFSENYNKLTVMDAHQERIFAEMLEEEKKHPDQVVFYHGTVGKYVLLNEFFTEFRRRLEHQYQGDYKVLRVFDDLFARFQNVTEFMAAYQNEHGLIDNYLRDYAEMGLSVNLFPFGSHDNHRSATFDYFLTSKSAKPLDVSKVFESFVATLNLDLDLQEFDKLYEKYYSKVGGGCYQIFIDKDVIDLVAYPAAPGGRPNPLVEDSLVRHETMSEVLEAISNDPATHSDYIQSLQGRLFLKPEIFHDPQKVQTRVYHANSLSPEEQLEFDKEMAALVDRSITQMLTEFSKLPDKIFARGQPGLYKLMQEVYQDISRLPVEQRANASLIISKLIEERNIQKLITLFEENDIDLSEDRTKRSYGNVAGKIDTEKSYLYLFIQAPEVAEMLYSSLLEGNSDKLRRLKEQLFPVIVNHYLETNIASLKTLFQNMPAEEKLAALFKLREAKFIPLQQLFIAFMDELPQLTTSVSTFQEIVKILVVDPGRPSVEGLQQLSKYVASLKPELISRESLTGIRVNNLSQYLQLLTSLPGNELKKDYYLSTMHQISNKPKSAENYFLLKEIENHYLKFLQLTTFCKRILKGI